MDDHLSVTVRVKTVSPGFQVPPQFEKVVYLAVEDHPDTFVLTVDRFAPTRYINDAQPAHAQSNRPVRVDALVIGSAVNEGLTHAMNVACVNYVVRFTHDAGYATHTLFPSPDFSSRPTQL